MEAVQGPFVTVSDLNGSQVGTLYNFACSSRSRQMHTYSVSTPLSFSRPPGLSPSKNEERLPRSPSVLHCRTSIPVMASGIASPFAYCAAQRNGFIQYNSTHVSGLVVMSPTILIIWLSFSAPESISRPPLPDVRI
jgi:hypothetical protein